MGVHEEVQREEQQQQQQAKDTSATARGAAEGACGVDSAAEGEEADHVTCSDSCQPGTSSSTGPPEAQPFVLPLGVMARNEVYPRTCRKW